MINIGDEVGFFTDDNEPVLGTVVKILQTDPQPLYLLEINETAEELMRFESEVFREG